MRSMNALSVVVLLCGMAAIAPTGAGAAPPATAGGHAHAHPAHAHPTVGPHHGALIELGREDYHAELVHDEATNTVTIYILDGGATKPVPIEAQRLALNLRVAGKPRQFFLAAAPQAGDPAGTSSAFAAADKQLCAALHATGASGRLTVEIAGRQYIGKVAGHTHAH